MIRLIVPAALWIATWEGLRRRGGGVRETACIWGGSRADEVERVERVVFLDDFGVDANAYSYVARPEAVHAALDDLHARRMRVVGDVHTHPGSWVGLSEIDRANPIEFRVGLKALVVPFFALDPPSLDQTGVHEYLGDRRWRTLSRDDAARAVALEVDQ